MSISNPSKFNSLPSVRRWPALGFLGLFGLLCLIPLHGADDTVVLKNGRTLRGEIISESGTSIQMKVAFSPTILEEREIPKSEITSIQRVQPEDAAYQKIKGVQSPDNVFTAAELATTIGRLEGFLRQYPASKFAPEIEARLQGIQAELQKLEEGEVKLEGRWISYEDADRERYQIEARRLFQQMRLSLEANDTIGTLKAFDEIDRSGSGSMIYPDAVDLALQSLRRLDATLNHQLRVLSFQEQEREINLKQETDEMRATVERARERELARAEAAFTAAQASGIKYPPYSTNSASSMNKLQEAVRQEIERLRGVATADMRRGVEQARQAALFLSQNRLQLARAALHRARESWAENEALTRLDERLELALAAAAEPTPTPIPSADTDAEAAATPEAEDNAEPDAEPQESAAVSD